MQLNDLLVIADFLGSLNKKHNYSNVFDQPANSLNQIASKPNEQQHRDNLQNQLDSLRDTIRALVPPKGWSLARQKLFRRFCRSEAIVEETLGKIQAAIDNNQVNPQGMRGGLLEVKKEITEIFSRATQLKSGLQPLIDEYQDDQELEKDELALQLIFDRDIDIKNIEELAINTKKWDEVFHYASIIVGEPAKKPRLVSIDKGSLILEVAAYSAVVSAIGLTVDVILGWAKKWYEVKKAKREAEKAELELEKEAKDQISEIYETQLALIEQKALQEVKEALLKEFDPKNQDGSRHKAIDESVKYLLKFVLSGGTVDIREPESTSKSENGDEVNKITTPVSQKINDRFSELRRLEKEFGELPQIPHIFDDESNDTTE